MTTVEIFKNSKYDNKEIDFFLSKDLQGKYLHKSTFTKEGYNEEYYFIYEVKEDYHIKLYKFTFKDGEAYYGDSYIVKLKSIIDNSFKLKFLNIPKEVEYLKDYIINENEKATGSS